MATIQQQDSTTATSFAFKLAVDLVTRMASNTLVKIPTVPFVNARLILQAQSADPELRQHSANRYTGTQEILMKIYKDQGLIACWRGFPVEVLKNTVQFFLSPFVFALQREITPRYNPRVNIFKFYLSSIGGGYLSGVCLQLLLRPFEYCRTKLILDSIGGGGDKNSWEYSGSLDVIKKTVKANGIRALYSGLQVSLLKTLVYRTSYFLTYDMLKAINPFANDRGTMRTISLFTISQAVAWISLALSYPFETVERKLQFQADKDEKECVYKGTIDCIKKTWKEEGISGFYQGIGNQIATIVVSTAILVVSDML